MESQLKGLSKRKFEANLSNNFTSSLVING